MNGESIPGNIILAIIIALFLLSNLFLKKRSMEKTDLGKVVNMLAERWELERQESHYHFAVLKILQMR